MAEFKESGLSSAFGRQYPISRPVLPQNTPSRTTSNLFPHYSPRLSFNTILQDSPFLSNERGSPETMNYSNIPYSAHPTFQVARRDIPRVAVTDPRIYGTMDLFFADLFWNAMKESNPDYPSWSTVESMRDDYPSVWSDEIASKVDIIRQQSQVFVLELLCTLKQNMEEAVTRDPNHLRAIFDRHVRQVALKILCGNNPYKKFLIFCALVTEMFISCAINSMDFPVNLVITSVADLACPYMKWQKLEDVVLFTSWLAFNEKETAN